MTPQAIIKELWEAGICIRLANDGVNLSVPAGRLNADLRALILANKSDIVEFLQEVDATTNALMEAAMRVCDHHIDNETKREAMRRECLAVPSHLKPDLLEHLQSVTQASRSGKF